MQSVKNLKNKIKNLNEDLLKNPGDWIGVQ
jgi:hypothetical protein